LLGGLPVGLFPVFAIINSISILVYFLEYLCGSFSVSVYLLLIYYILPRGHWVTCYMCSAFQDDANYFPK
jgi:hypothetical protein